ncbi:MAG: DUF4194 domain-containing protein [Clostridiales Family XIII bacterium]|jgi:hypothetical protein|nr:DUF4194 domain-containing protein [Clostridiales Family XIII bacterium]
MWNETYEKLSNYDKGEFRRLCNYLMSHTYLVRDVYKPDKQWTEPNNDYRMINRMFEVMREYFSVSGWSLERDENYGVISLTSEFEHNRLRMDRFTTLFLYTCRLIYEEGREQGDNLHIVHTYTGEVVEKMRLLGLLDKGKTTQKERLEAQRTLAHFNIIQKTETTAWNPDGNGVLIFPSILSIITNQGINDMMSELEELRAENAESAAHLDAEDAESLAHLDAEDAESLASSYAEEQEVVE